MFKFAFKNIKSKPLRTIGTILAIAIAVAMIFCMLSFKSAVYEFIYASETASKGNSDIFISTKSNSSRITEVTNPLKSVNGVSEIVSSLTVYALLGNEYIQVRGYEEEKIESLQKIDLIQNDSSSFRTDDVIISKACAEHFNLSIGDKIALSLGDNKADFYVWGISNNSGYFLSDSPYQLIGRIKQVARLAIGIESDSICNEIYIKVSQDADVNTVIESIKVLPEYSNLKVDIAKDESYIKEQTSSLTAPVVLSGAAVLALSIVFIIILFLMSSNEKINQIAKYSVVGATKKQICQMFVIESSIYAIIGAIIGALLGVGVFVGILKLTLSSLLVFSINPLKLFGASIIGIIVSILSSLLPMAKSFKGSVRENQLNIDKKTIWYFVIPIALVTLTIASVIVEFLVPNVQAIFAIITIALSLLSLGVVVGYIIRFVGKMLSKSNTGEIKYAAFGLAREKRFTKSITLLTVGMTIVMMLFMAWNLTTTIFNGYINNFENMIFVSNIQSSTDVTKFSEVDGVDGATKMVWGKGEISSSSFTKTLNILGSKDALNMLDFKYITDESAVKEAILSNEPYALVDIALQELYSVKVGDVLSFEIDGVKHDIIIGGILQHELFSGNYIVMSAENIATYFDRQIDTILVTTSKDTTECVYSLRAKFSDNNFYVVEVLEAYKWDKSSMEAVFSLIGTLAVVVALFIFIVTVASSLIGRSGSEKERIAMLSCGMSKNSLLSLESFQYVITSIISYALSFAISVLITSSLIHALRLFGLYFEFMYSAWVVALVGGVMAILYALVPVAIGFKKYYNIKKL